jgi:pyruvate/2-oxoglutarate dehydrogenase complex dihydrolipoamide dehydrogenase (E3) component
MDVDVLVLGWGKGGKTLAGALGRAGRNVAVVERSADMYGGSCININCVPTKTLIHDATNRPDDADPADWFAGSVDRRDTLTATLRARATTSCSPRSTPSRWCRGTRASSVPAASRSGRGRTDW